MQRATHAFADHVQEACRLPGDEYIAFSEHVAVDQRWPEILAAAFVIQRRAESHTVLFRQIIDDVPMFRCEIITPLETDADNLPAIARMAPGVVPEAGMEPEMEIVRAQRAIDDVVKYEVLYSPTGFTGLDVAVYIA